MMKKKQSQFSLFADKKLAERVEMSSVKGGNYSDIQYQDSSNGGKKYDILVPSLMETIKSSKSIDKPGLVGYDSDFSESFVDDFE